MILDDERTKELFAWAVRFSSMQLQAEDVRYSIRAHVAKIVEHIRAQPDLSGFSDDEVRELDADRARMITQLDFLRVSAVAVATSATLEQVQEKHTARTKKSAQTRGTNAAKHWTGEWLNAAHISNPSFRAERLAQEARKVHALNQPDITAKVRAEITVYRAKIYLRDKAKR